MDENGPRLRAAGKPWQRAATPGPAAGECGPAFAYLSRPRAPLGACDRDAEALAPLLAATGPPTSQLGTAEELQHVLQDLAARGVWNVLDGEVEGWPQSCRENGATCCAGNSVPRAQ